MIITTKYCVNPFIYIISRNRDTNAKRLRSVPLVVQRRTLRALGTSNLPKVGGQLNACTTTWTQRSLTPKPMLSPHKTSLRSLICVTWGHHRMCKQGANADHVRFPSVSRLLGTECKHLLTRSLVNTACLKPEKILWGVYASCEWQSCACPKLNKVKDWKRRRGCPQKLPKPLCLLDTILPYKPNY